MKTSADKLFPLQLHLHNLKLDRQTQNDRLSKLEHEVGSIKHILSGNTFQSFSQIPPNSNLANEQIKRSNLNLSYGVINSADNYDESFHVKRYVSQSPPRRHDNEGEDECFDGSHVIQLEKDTLKLRRELQDAIASKKNAESRILAYVFAFYSLFLFDQLLSFLFVFFTAISLCSLEHLVTSLKSPPSQQTNNNYHSPNNQAFIQPQQHQLQIQLNGGDQAKQKRSVEQHISTPVGSQTVGKLMSPKTAKASPVQLSSNGPVTDL